MNESLDKALVKDFPLLYKDRNADMRSTAMCWGFDVGDGWEPVIRELSAQLEGLIQKVINENPDNCFCHCARDKHENGTGKCSTVFKWEEKQANCRCTGFETFHPCASQVKEKFGGLRFYMTCSSNEMEECISKAEGKARVTCEVCGSTGKTRDDNGWLATLCQPCVNKRKAERKAMQAMYDDKHR